jgi:hypothetical protein
MALKINWGKFKFKLDVISKSDVDRLRNLINTQATAMACVYFKD